MFAAQSGTYAPVYSRAREAHRQVTSRLLLQCHPGDMNIQTARLHQYATCALIQLLSGIASLSAPSLLADSDDDEGCALTVMRCLPFLLVHVHPGNVPEGVVERARVVVHEV